MTPQTQQIFASRLHAPACSCVHCQARQGEQQNESRAKKDRAIAVRRARQQKARRRRRPTDPRSTSQLRAIRRLMALLVKARRGVWTHLSMNNKKRLIDKFVRLLRVSGLPQVRQNKLQGDFDEYLRTPRRSSQQRMAQRSYLAGGLRLPGQTTRGSARPDYAKSIRLPSGKVVRAHFNLKSDQVHRLSKSAAKSRAGRHLKQARRNARALPHGEPIVLSYLHRPAKGIQIAMRNVLFQRGSPVAQLRFGSTTYHNPAF